MKIILLQCKDFRSFVDTHFDFMDEVAITGDNYQGKSSIAEGIVFAVFGTTLTGSPQTDHLIRKGAKEMEVTLVFHSNGKEYEIIRTKSAKKSEVYLDGKKSTQSEIDRIVGEKEKFLAVFSPGYFTSLADKDAREMLMNLVKPPTQADVLAQLAKPDQELLKHEVLRDPEALAKEKRAEIKACEADYQKTMGQIEILRERVEREVPELKTIDEAELRDLRAKLQEAEAGMPSKIREMRTTLSSMGRQYESLKSQIQDVPDAPYQIGDSCPTCGQDLNGDALGKVLHQHTLRSTDIKNRNEQFKQQALAVVEDAKKLRTDLESLEEQFLAQSTADIKQRITELEQTKSEVDAHNGYVNRLRMELVDDKERLEKAQANAAELKNEQDVLSLTIQSITNYMAKLAEMQVNQLTQHLHRVGIELFKLVKTTGEMKPCFTVTYDGKEYKSLSYSEQIRCNLEFSTLFNKVTGMNYPVFIDNAESITHFDTPVTDQLFLASVVQGQELSVMPAEHVKGDVA